MKLLTGRLLAKANKLQDILSTVVEESSDVVVERSDRAADVSMATGYSSRYDRGQRQRQTFLMHTITNRGLKFAGILAYCFSISFFFVGYVCINGVAIFLRDIKLQLLSSRNTENDTIKGRLYERHLNLIDTKLTQSDR